MMERVAELSAEAAKARGGIPIADLIRLLDNAIADELRRDPSMFDFWMTSGFSVTPQLDYQDKATLARIAAGERYDR